MPLKGGKRKSKKRRANGQAGASGCAPKTFSHCRHLTASSPLPSNSAYKGSACCFASICLDHGEKKGALSLLSLLQIRDLIFQRRAAFFLPRPMKAHALVAPGSHNESIVPRGILGSPALNRLTSRWKRYAGHKTAPLQVLANMCLRHFLAASLAVLELPGQYWRACGTDYCETILGPSPSSV